jgi:hypothetical protein
LRPLSENPASFGAFLAVFCGHLPPKPDKHRECMPLALPRR